jgi:hypothetical protein
VWGKAALQFDNKVTVAEYYTVTIGGTSTDLTTLQSVVANVTNTTDVSTPEKIEQIIDETPGGATGQTFTLTANIDNIVGTSGNDTISGVVSATAGESTLTLADAIDGAGGTDTLKILVSGTINLPSSQITNVENIVIKDLSGGNTHSLANVSGEQSVILEGSTGNTTITNLDKAVIGLKDMTGAAATQTFIFKDTAFANTATLEISLENAGNKVTAQRQTIDIQTTSASGAANAVSIAATGNNYVTFSASTANDVAAAGGVKTLTVTGSGALDIDSASDVGGGALKTNLTTVNLSGNSGGVTMQVDKTTVVVTGGSGADKITIGGAMTKGASFNLGAGNDQLLVAAGGSVDANVVIDAGDGIDTVSNGLITVANGSIFKNFEKIAIDSATTTDVELLTGSTISSLLINGNVSATVQNVASGSTIDVTSTTAAGTITVGVKNATASTSDSLKINFDGAAQAATPAAANIKAGTVVANGVESLNIVSGGGANTWNSLTLTDDKLKTITITGSKNLDLAFTGTNGTNTSGKGAVSMIDASALTGKLAINLANVTYDGDVNGFTLKGGTGNDTITTNASSATLYGGGGNDKFVVTASVLGGTDATTGVITTIADFNAGDQIAVTTLTALTKTQTDIATATNLTQAVDLALKNASVGQNTAAWFNYGGNTYVAIEGDATDGISASDIVIKLTGVLDLTNATVSSNTITMV